RFASHRARLDSCNTAACLQQLSPQCKIAPKKMPGYLDRKTIHAGSTSTSVRMTSSSAWGLMRFDPLPTSYHQPTDCFHAACPRRDKADPSCNSSAHKGCQVRENGTTYSDASL